MRILSLGAWSVAALLVCASQAHAEVQPYKFRVLLVNSYHQNLPWTADLTRSVIATFAADREHPTDLMVENMDTKRINSPAHLDAFLELLRVKYATRPPDLIIASDNNALSLVIEHRRELFPGVPVVFCGVNDFNLDMLKGETGVTGVPEVPKIRSTAELARLLLPETERFVVVHDFLNTGLAWKAEAMRQLAGLSVEVTYAPPLPRDRLLDYLAHLPPHTVVLLLAYFAGGDGVYHPADESVSLMAQATSAPIFGALDFQLGDGIVGGDLIGGALQGERAAAMAKEILHGARPDDIPIAAEGTSVLTLDWRMLKRFGIDPDRAPHTIKVVYQPDEGFAISPVTAMGAVAVILIEGVIVTLLVINIRRRRRAEAGLRYARKELERKIVERTRDLEESNEALSKEVLERRAAMESLADSEERYRQMFHLNTAVKLLIDPQTGNILEANEAAARFYGYRRDILLTMKISDLNILSPDEVAHEMALAQSQRRLHFNFRHRLASGEIKDVEVYSGPLKIRDKTLLFSIILDVTERRRSEAAHASHERVYQSLFEEMTRGTLHLDREGNVARINDTAAALFGYTPKEMEGKAWRGFLHPDERETGFEGMRGKTSPVRRRVITSEGKVMRVSLALMTDAPPEGRTGDYLLIVETVIEAPSPA